MESAIIQILAFKKISERFKIRDATYFDAHVCNLEEDTVNVRPGDVRWASKAVCISVPGLEEDRQAGQDLDTENLAEGKELSTEVTNCF